MPDNYTKLKTRILQSVSGHQTSMLSLVVEVLAIENCRINEVLNARWVNFHPDNFLILKGSKSSQDIIVRDREILRKISLLHHFDDVLIFYPLKYYHVYKYLKENYSHLFNRFKTAKNCKVTHGFRYLSAALSNDEQSLKAILHHNSIRSQKYYKQ